MPSPVLETLFQAFEEASVLWCALRVPANPGVTGGDIDLLVAPNHVARIRHVLEAREFAQLPWPGPGFHFLRYVKQNDQWLWLHVVTQLAFGPFYTLEIGAEAGCLERRLYDGAAIALAPDDAFWMLLLHCLLDKSSIPVRHTAPLHKLANTAQPDSPLAELVRRICPPGWSPDRMLTCARQGDWETLEQIAPTLTSSWMIRAGVGRWRLRFYRGLRLINKLLNAWRQRGLSVAVIGPDGAGKSTLIAGIQATFIFPVHPVYMGLTGGRLQSVAKLRLPLLVLVGRLGILWSRYLLAQYYRMRGRLVIFDRYTYDGLVSSPHQLSRFASWWRRLEAHACPAPDLILLLDAPGELMYQRKGEYDAETLEQWRRQFLALQERIAGLQVVDTTRPEHEVLIDVLDRIWQRYAARWRRNGDFVEMFDEQKPVC